MVTGSFRYGPGGKKEYRIGGRLVEASSLAEALEVARRNMAGMQYELEDMPEGALAMEPRISGEAARAADRRDENIDLRAERANAAMASGRPGQYDSGLARVPEGDQPWLRDPRILQPPPGGWPHAERFGMDVADLARRAGVSEGQADEVIRYMMEGRLPSIYTGGVINEPDEARMGWDDPQYRNYYPSFGQYQGGNPWVELGGGYGRKTVHQWNLPAGEEGTDPNMRGMYRERLNSRDTSEGETRVYRTLLGMDPEAQQFAIGGKTYRADNFEAALRKFNADPARLDNRGNPTTITLPTATTEQAASTALDQPAARPMPGIDRGTGDPRRWMGGGPGRTTTEFIPRGDADRGMQFADEYSGDYFPTTDPRRGMGGGPGVGYTFGQPTAPAQGTMGIGPAGDASLDPTTQTIYGMGPGRDQTIQRNRNYGGQFVDEYSGAYYPTADPRRMMGGGPGRVMQPRQFIGSGDMSGGGANEDLGWYGGATYAQQNPGVLASPMGFGPRGDPPGEAASPITLDMMDWGPEEMGYGVGPQGPGGMLGWGDNEDLGWYGGTSGIGPRIPPGVPTSPIKQRGDPGLDKDIGVVPRAAAGTGNTGRSGLFGRGPGDPVTKTSPWEAPKTLEEVGFTDPMLGNIAFEGFLNRRFGDAASGLSRGFYRGLQPLVERGYDLASLLGEAPVGPGGKTGYESYLSSLEDRPTFGQDRIAEASAIIAGGKAGLTAPQISAREGMIGPKGQRAQFDIAIQDDLDSVPVNERQSFYNVALNRFYQVLAETAPQEVAAQRGIDEWDEQGQPPEAAGQFQFLPWYQQRGFELF